MSEPLPAYLPLAEADPKPWWQSTTVIGGAAVLVSQLASLIGYQVDASLTLEVITSLVGLAGGVVAIWGRIHAVQPIRR